MKMRGLETKYIFKRAVQDFVPDEILNRPKQGFGMPVQQWINQELRGYIRDMLTDQKTRERGYFNSSYVDLLLDEHERERRDHATPLWTLFMLELWHRAFYDRAPSAVNCEMDFVPAGVV
jgi:asparagine synthase (glutamine-hydrolysing)